MPPRRKRQSKITSHFNKSPRFSQPFSAGLQRQTGGGSEPDSSPGASEDESEGSEGLAAIHLTPTAQSSQRPTLTRQRAQKRVVDDSDQDGDEEMDEGIQPLASSSRPKRKACLRPPPIDIASTSASDDGSIDPNLDAPSQTGRNRCTRETLEVVVLPSSSRRNGARSATNSPTLPRSARSQTVRSEPYVEIPVLPKSRLRKYLLRDERRPKSAPISSLDSSKRVRIASVPPTAPVVPLQPVSNDEDNIPLTISRKGKEKASPEIERGSGEHSNAVAGSSKGVEETSISLRKNGRPPAIQVAPISSDSEDDEPIIRTGRRKPPSAGNKPSREKEKAPESSMSRRNTSHHDNSKEKKKKKRRIQDPDEAGEAVTDEEDVDDLKMDEPSRFKTTSRLRKKKETDWQRKVRKLKNARMGIVESSTEEEESEESEVGEESSGSSDMASEEFIVEDGGHVEQGLLPFEFSMESAQTPEYKFKVVFHYLVLLVMKGPKILPLKGEDAAYFTPQLKDLRRKMAGYRDARVAGQIWRHEFIQTLRTYPTFDVEYLEHAEYGCDVCHISGRRSRFRVFLGGNKYDPETHAVIEEGDSSSDSEDDQDESSRSFLMGRFCKRRAGVYHQMSHWEDNLFHRVRGYYHDLKRAKIVPLSSDSEASSSESDPDESEDEKQTRKADRSAARLRTAQRVRKMKENHKLVDDWRNVDRVTEWMDTEMGYSAKSYKWLEDMIVTSEQLEHDRSRDD